MFADRSTESHLLESARGGDRGAFDSLVAGYVSSIHVHCYAMLGSVADADDALQETLLRAWRGLPGFEGRSSLRTWLFTIATNASLKLIQRRPRRVLPFHRSPTNDSVLEPAWLEPYPDELLGVEDGRAAPDARYEQRESVELSFVAAVQHLSARHRAVLLLRDVLGFSAREVADSLGSTLGSVNSTLHRARTIAAKRVPRQSQQATLRALGDERQRQIVAAYVEAWECGDIEAVVRMLTDDARWSMPPLLESYVGLTAVVAFLQDAMRNRWRNVPARANGQLAVGCYLWDAEKGTYAAAVLDVLTLRGECIEEVTSFVDPGLFERFRLPDALPA